jgi:2-(1,2-epoxy-1,2-dihydrophenyl)acetyl-CoA isomerase
MDPNRAPEEARRRQQKLLSDLFIPLARMPKPTVAAVAGHAHGAGLSLALACDVVIVGEDAPMSFGYVLRGLTPDCGIAYFLPRLVGMARAKDLLLTGRRFDGAEAEQLGLVAAAVPTADVLGTAQERARGLAGGATVALALAKRMLDQAQHLSLEDLADVEAYSQAVTRSTQDHREAIEAFRSKRSPVFLGR